MKTINKTTTTLKVDDLGHCRHIPHRRRHRRHEHHAGIGNLERHRRDRYPDGGRGTSGGYHAAVPDRVGSGLPAGGDGIVCAWGVGKVFSLFVSSFAMQFSLMSIVSAFFCSTLIGVIFGFLPARNAARLDPIEALARE